MNRKRLAAIGDTIITYLAAAGAAARLFHGKDRRPPPDVRAANEMRRISDMAKRYAWGSDPAWWPSPWGKRYRDLANTIDRHHNKAP